MLSGEHYETLVLFVVYFVLKMFKNIDFYIKTRCTQSVRVFFSRARMYLVTVLVSLNLALILEKLCKVNRRMFEIVAHHNVDNWTKGWTFYLAAGNPSINCR